MISGEMANATIPMSTNTPAPIPPRPSMMRRLPMFGTPKVAQNAKTPSVTARRASGSSPSQ